MYKHIYSLHKKFVVLKLLFWEIVLLILRSLIFKKFLKTAHTHKNKGKEKT